MDDIWPSFFFPSGFSEYSHLEAGEALEHGLLRPLNSNLRSEVTSDVIWSSKATKKAVPGNMHINARAIDVV